MGLGGGEGDGTSVGVDVADGKIVGDGDWAGEFTATGRGEPELTSGPLAVHPATASIAIEITTARPGVLRMVS
ncbi:MAG TPA: hypothetical protein VNY84_10840, partial [Acidimicrobiales bacterium]|nr:hypothetical protein [Acidimicrobiales bacterium]